MKQKLIIKIDAEILARAQSNCAEKKINLFRI